MAINVNVIYKIKLIFYTKDLSHGIDVTVTIDSTNTVFRKNF